MADNLADMMHREWNLTNTDSGSVPQNVSSSRLLQPSLLARRSPDRSNSSNGSHHNLHQHGHQSQHSPPIITTTDYSDSSSLPAMRVKPSLFNRKSSDIGYHTDGGTQAAATIPKYQHKSSNGYDHLISPRLSLKRSTARTSPQSSDASNHHPLSHHSHLTVHPSLNIGPSHDKGNKDSIYGRNTHREEIRRSRRVPRTSPPGRVHREEVSRSPSMSHSEKVLAATTTSGRPFRLIFMRHSERANQALGRDWYSKAFRTNTYKAYDQNLPIVLPKRNSNQAYEFDTPLTALGLKNARNTGRAMLSLNLTADMCLSSTALRCIQTSERILKGMERHIDVSIRIEPGLFECPHVNHKTVESFMTKAELTENGYNIKREYKPLIEQINVPESLDEYFDRCFTVMRGIIDRYGPHGGTILLVTHAPGILALTDAIKGARPNQDTFYRTVATYPPLAICISEYDGTKWKHSEQPFAINPLRQ